MNFQLITVFLLTKLFLSEELPPENITQRIFEGILFDLICLRELILYSGLPMPKSKSEP